VVVRMSVRMELVLRPLSAVGAAGPAGSRQQAAGSRQQAAGSRQRPWRLEFTCSSVLGEGVQETATEVMEVITADVEVGATRVAEVRRGGSMGGGKGEGEVGGTDGDDGGGVGGG
jgi:hypothetical protein